MNYGFKSFGHLMLVGGDGGSFNSGRFSHAARDVLRMPNDLGGVMKRLLQVVLRLLNVFPRLGGLGVQRRRSQLQGVSPFGVDRWCGRDVVQNSAAVLRGRPDMAAGRATVVVDASLLARRVEFTRRFRAAPRTGLYRHADTVTLGSEAMAFVPGGSAVSLPRFGHLSSRRRDAPAARGERRLSTGRSRETRKRQFLQKAR